jgi:hypothetical protein
MRLWKRMGRCLRFLPHTSLLVSMNLLKGSHPTAFCYTAAAWWSALCPL